MMMTYNNMQEVDKDLEKLRFKRDFSIREINMIKEVFKDQYLTNKWFILLQQIC